MPTQEERLSLLKYDLDQFKAEATTYYQEMAMQVTMSKGLTEDAVKRLMQLRIQVDKRFTGTDQQLADVKQDLSEVKQDLSEMKTVLTQILARLPEKS
jgi:ferritin-like protein